MQKGFVPTGREIIPCIYDKGHYFLEGVAAECLNGKWGMVDHFNNTIIPFEYEDIFVCKNNLINVQKNEKWGFEYDKLGECKEGMIYAEKDKHQYFIDKRNNKVITFNEDFFVCGISWFNEGFVQGWTKEQGDVYINKKGEILDIKLD